MTSGGRLVSLRPPHDVGDLLAVEAVFLVSFVRFTFTPTRVFEQSGNITCGLRTAGELETSCRTNVAILKGTEMDRTRDSMDIGISTGFIQGWWEGATSVLVWSPSPTKNPFRLEVRKGVSVDQIRKVFVKYKDKHPENKNEPAAWGLMDALFDAKLARYTEVPNHQHKFVGKL